MPINGGFAVDSMTDNGVFAPVSRIMVNETVGKDLMENVPYVVRGIPAGVRLIGYARVSSAEQKTDLQLDALLSAGCHAIYEDQITGVSHCREGLDAALSDVTAGDKLVVWRLDRLGRSIPHVMSIIAELAEKGASLVSLCESFDTGTESGELYSTILAMIAHVERRMIASRTRAGLQAKRDRGQRLGPQPKMTLEQAKEARCMMARPDMTADIVASRFAVGRATLFRHMKSVRTGTGTGTARI